MFDPIYQLKHGNEQQKCAYRAISELEIMENLSEFQPMLCGTFPLDIAVGGSDLDIIMEVHDFDQFETKVIRLYRGMEGFSRKRNIIRNVPIVKANFVFGGFEFELFGQPQPTKKQNAYLHMIVEYHLIQADPSIKGNILMLKEQGYKTEPAFCKVLGLDGDPYGALIEFGKTKNYIE
ncbi:DUF4269 domain-containing protein [Aquibacillus koreensis]|uniref:DUF4269 domain-containing protein n=1 Tax=Aquibacillus koreensis TaxID=279446 RepID=A0A9X4AJY0_9BACI|nr:DUF4269 domain-containing protein [Aquibacillus koreensis]MCT2538238.1 DUF4269 domain-containing protein [Aquibacillus koreensis]MDC3420818.1 DUF4269 domain-containing protein [Aquibacillus koreensis]